MTRAQDRAQQAPHQGGAKMAEAANARAQAAAAGDRLSNASGTRVPSEEVRPWFVRPH